MGLSIADSSFVRPRAYAIEGSFFKQNNMKLWVKTTGASRKALERALASEGP